MRESRPKPKKALVEKGLGMVSINPYLSVVFFGKIYHETLKIFEKVLGHNRPVL